MWFVLLDLNAYVSAPLFYCLSFNYYYTHSEGSQPAKLCFVMLLNIDKFGNVKDSARNTFKLKTKSPQKKKIDWQICQGEQGFPHNS